MNLKIYLDRDGLNINAIANKNMEQILYKIYQKLGDFFTGSLKRYLFYAIIFIILTIILIFESYFRFEIKAETLSWVFSTIVQSLMALVALVGVIVIFKYQSMSTREDRLLEELNKDTSDLAKLGGNLTATSAEELLQNIKPHTPEPLSNNDGFRTIKLRTVKQELKAHIFIRSFLGDYMLKFTIYVFLIAVFDLVALAIVSLLSLNSILSITILYISIFFVADILRLVIKIVAEAIS